jgi:hypothetical protein
VNTVYVLSTKAQLNTMEYADGTFYCGGLTVGISGGTFDLPTDFDMRRACPTSTNT